MKTIVTAIVEWWMSRGGYRQGGAMERTASSADHIASVEDARQLSAFASIGQGHSPLLAWENFYNQNQGQTMHCVAYAIAHALSYMLTAKYERMITIEGEYIARLLTEAGIMTLKGAYIDDSVQYITDYSKKVGIVDTYGNVYIIDKCTCFTAGSIVQLQLQGYPVVTGALINAPMCDNKWVLEKSSLSKNVGGHAFLGVPMRKVIILPDGRNVTNFENSWKNWGIAYLKNKGRSGQFHVPINEACRLFRCYIFTDVSVAESPRAQ